MKKLFYVGALSTLLLVACGDKEVEKTPEELAKAHGEAKKKAEEKALAEASKLNNQESDEESDFDLFEDDPVPEKGGEINIDQVKAIIEYYGLGEEDKLVDATLNNEEIIATIEVTDKATAEIRYGSIASELLLHKGWEVLTVNFVNIGTVSMNRSQQKDEGFGPYFPTLEIMKQLEGK